MKRGFIIFLIILFLYKKRRDLYKLYYSRYFSQKILVEDSSYQLEGIKNAFISNYYLGREKGSQLTLTINGKIVLDIQAGRDEESIHKGLTMIFSSTKVIESLLIAMLVDRGMIKYDDPVSKYWKEFGTQFSNTTTISQLMRHEAGLEQIHSTLCAKEAKDIFTTWEKIEKWVFKALKVDEDVKSGERKARYHAITRGILVEVLVQKITGMTGREFIQKFIVDPLEKKHSTKIHFYLGCPDELQDQMAECEPAASLPIVALELLLHKIGFIANFIHPGVNASEEELLDHYQDYLKDYEAQMTFRMLQPNSMERKALILTSDVGLGAFHLANHPTFRSIPLLSVTGIADSRSLALITSELACGGGILLSPEGLREAMKYDETVYDELMCCDMNYTQCGWSPDRLGPDFAGWAGAGGGVNVFSTKYRSSLCYIPTKLEGRTHKPNGVKILNEFRKLLERI